MTIVIFGLIFGLGLVFQSLPVLAQDLQFAKFKVGNLEIVSISDSTGTMSTSLLRDIDIQTALKAALEGGLAQDKAEASAFPSFINTFVVKLPQGLVLIDAGLGVQGQTLMNLAAAGISPDQIKAVLLTHFHGDHVGGLIDQDGKAAFPEAIVYAATAEDSYWLDRGKPRNELVPKVLNPYKQADRYKLVSPEDEVFPGVKVVELYGHTPGHVGFLFEGGEQDFLAWGDIVHIALVQFAHPEATLQYDVDTVKAAETRKKIFNEAAQKGYVVAGAHLPFAGLGQVQKKGSAYAFSPLVP
jgi:glyoxylase-like metal-dependent hydrolase (beta-lactamase superfamily II)